MRKTHNEKTTQAENVPMRRMSKARFLLTAVVFLGVFSCPAEPAILLSLEIEELTEISDLIVLGNVLDVKSGWNETHSRICTRVTLKVQSVFRGSCEGETLTINLPGGVVPEDNLGQTIPGVPKFEIGEEAVVFLCLDPDLLCPLAGWVQGKFPVVSDPPTGRKLVLDRFGKCRSYLARKSGRRDVKTFSEEQKLSLEEFVALVAEVQAIKASGEIRPRENLPASGSLLTIASDLPSSTDVSGGYEYSGFKWRDQDIPVPYYVYTGKTPPNGIALKTYVNAVVGAFQKWEDVPTSYMAFHYRGETSAYPPKLDVTDGRNVVGWTDDRSLGTALALTVYWYSLPGNHLTEFDIGLNINQSWSASTPTPFWSFDLHTTALHEAGHTLSLDDVYDGAFSNQVMFYGIWSGQMKRELGVGDIAGIAFVYPNESDLVVSEVQGPSSALEHERINVSATVQNAGGRTAGKCWLEFYLSLNSTPGEWDIPLGQSGIPSLSGGQAYKASISVEVPAVLSERNYYVHAIADAQHQIQEAREDNNTDSYFPLKVTFDKDADGLPNWWEVEMSLDPNDSTGDNGSSGDPDADGLVNVEEYRSGSNPRLADTDGDGSNDRDEVIAGTDPSLPFSVFHITHIVVNSEGSDRAGCRASERQTRVAYDRWLTIYWTTVSGKQYQVYYQDSPGAEWMPLGSVHIGSGWLVGQNDLEGLYSPSRFYRVRVQ